MRAWREKRGLSLSGMAALTGIHKSTMSRMESGKVPYHRDILEAYARVIGCHPGDLISRPPGVADELFRLLGQCGPEDLQRLEEMTKLFLEQRGKRNLQNADN
jgi:transcriptional regulator with XRE-family HTH domain